MDTELGTNPVEVNFIVPASEDGIVPHVPQQTVSYAELPTYFNTELDALPSLHLLTPDELKASLFPKKSDRNASTVTMNIQPLIVSPETTTMIAALQSPNNPYVYMGDPAQLQPLSIAVKSHVVEVPVTSAPASPLSSSYPVYSPPVESPVTASPVESDPAAPASSAGGDN
jgi:hypothetical protein